MIVKADPMVAKAETMMREAVCSIAAERMNADAYMRPIIVLMTTSDFSALVMVLKICILISIVGGCEISGVLKYSSFVMSGGWQTVIDVRQEKWRRL